MQTQLNRLKLKRPDKKPVFKEATLGADQVEIIEKMMNEWEELKKSGQRV